MGVFSQFATKYHDAGLSIIPLKQKAKSPIINNWSIYCGQIVDDDTLSTWETKYRECNLGVCLGEASGLVAFDFDYDNSVDCKEVEDIIKKILPPSPVIKKGKKGWTAFYRYNGEPSRAYQRGAHRMVDLLSTGKQTVLPPSIHPQGMKYEWVTGNLIDINPKELPTLPANLDVVLTALVKGTKEELKSGRHDLLVKYIFQNIEHVSSVDALAEMCVDFDKRSFPSRTYLDDYENYPEFKGKSPLENAVKIITRCENTVKRKKIDRDGEDWSVGLAPAGDVVSRWAEVVDGKVICDYDGFAEYMRDVVGLKFFSENYSYIFNGAFYEPIEKLALRQYIKERVSPVCKINHIKMFHEYVEVVCQVRNGKIQNDEGKINFKNGLFDLSLGKLRGVTKDDFLLYQLPYDYVEGATCPKFEEFLLKSLEDPSLVESVFEIIGYLLIADRPWLQKAIILDGDGSNGKSVLLKVIQMLLGRDNYSTISLEQMAQPFFPIFLMGKKANVCEELPQSRIPSNMFKNLVSGGMITASEKFKRAVTFECTAKFIMAVNGLPAFDDNSHGMLRRLYLIKWNKIVKQDDIIPNFELSFENELSGIFFKSMLYYNKLVDRGHLQEHCNTAQAIEEYKQNDLIYNFISTRLFIDEKSERYKPTKFFYLEYQKFCQDNFVQDNRMMNLIVFSRLFKKELASWLTRHGHTVTDFVSFFHNKVQYRMISVNPTQSEN